MAKEFIVTLDGEMVQGGFSSIAKATQYLDDRISSWSWKGYEIWDKESWIEAVTR